MEFCIATVVYWQSVGFDTSDWRKSTDGTKAIIHSEYAKVLCNTISNPSIQTYSSPSEEFSTVLNSPEWVQPIFA